MMMDPIADMLTRIRNAQKSRKRSIELPFSKLRMRVAELLQKEGYVEAVSQAGEATKPTMAIVLKYYGKQPAIQAIIRESSPGHRMYRKADELPRVQNDYGIAIISTSRGLMTNKEARKAGMGGEVICSVY